MEKNSSQQPWTLTCKSLRKLYERFFSELLKDPRKEESAATNQSIHHVQTIPNYRLFSAKETQLGNCNLIYLILEFN